MTCGRSVTGVAVPFGQNGAVAAMVVGDVAMFVDVEGNVAQLGAVVAALLIAAINAVHLRVVLPDEAGRGRDVVLGGIDPVVPKIVNMRGKNGFGLISPDQTE